MNKQILIALVVLIDNCIHYKSNCMIVPELEDNLFHDINNNLQKTINKIFTLLKLNKTFSDDYETRLLLSMFASLKGVSEKKYKLYKDLTNVSRLDDVYHKLKNNSLFKLDKLVELILAEDFKVPRNTRKSINGELKNSIEIPDNSAEAFILLRDHLINVENVELADISKPSPKIRKIYEKHKNFRRARRGNFKLWKLPNTSEPLSSDTRRLFNGVQMSIKSYPFVASVHVKNKFICTGAVLSRDMVITAASCLHELQYNPRALESNPQKLAVRVGSDFPDRFGDYILASDFYVHPDYDVVTLRNNLAIIKIKKHIHLRNKNKKIRRIDYQRKKIAFTKDKHDVIILGWGNEEQDESKGAPTNNNDKNKKNSLSRSRLQVLPNLKDCIKVYTIKYLSENNFCAGFSDTGTGACQRDIGGPAIFGSALVGVVSYGPLVCGTPDAPTVFTNVGKYSDWIGEILQKGSKDVPTTTMRYPETNNNNRFKVIERQGTTATTMKVATLAFTRFLPKLTEEIEYNVYNNEDKRRATIYTKKSIIMPTTKKADETRIETQNENPQAIISNVMNKFPKAIELLTSALNQIMIEKDEGNSEYDSKKEDNEKDKSKNSFREFVDNSITNISPNNSQNNIKDEHLQTTPENILRNIQNENEMQNAYDLFENAEENDYEEQKVDTSDSENYESKEGLSIEEPTGIVRETTPTIINNPDSLKKTAQSMIKDFVQNKLAPMSNQLGLNLDMDFEKKAEKFLIENFVSNQLSLVNNLSTNQHYNDAPEQEFDTVTYKIQDETKNNFLREKRVKSEHIFSSLPTYRYQPHVTLVEKHDNNKYYKKDTTRKHFKLRITPPQRHTRIYSDEALPTVNPDDIFKNFKSRLNETAASNEFIQPLPNTEDDLQKQLTRFKDELFEPENKENMQIDDFGENQHERPNAMQANSKNLQIKPAATSNDFVSKAKNGLLMQIEVQKKQTTGKVTTTFYPEYLDSSESAVSKTSKDVPIFRTAPLYDDDQDHFSFRSQDDDARFLLDKLMNAKSSQELKTVDFDQYHNPKIDNSANTQELYEILNGYD